MTSVNGSGQPCIVQTYNGNPNDCMPVVGIFPCNPCIGCDPLPPGSTNGCLIPDWVSQYMDASAVDNTLLYPVGCGLIIPRQQGGAVGGILAQICSCDDEGNLGGDGELGRVIEA